MVVFGAVDENVEAATISDLQVTRIGCVTQAFPVIKRTLV